MDDFNLTKTGYIAASKSSLGFHNDDDLKTKEQFELALEYIIKSAESGYVEALTEMGHVYELGGIRDPKSGKLFKLTKKSLEKAKELYQESADQGCELA